METKNLIPTVEEYLKQRLYITKDGSEDVHDSLSNVCDAVKGIIQLHVTAALQEALDSIPCLGSSSDIATYEEVEEAVLNAYPLDEIK